MKPILSTLLFLLFSFQLMQGQVVEQTTNNSQQELYDFYTLEQKRNNTIGWILLGGGAAMITGSIIAIQQADWDDNYDVAAIFNVIGTLSTLTSVPFFISAGSNKRKARLYLKGVPNTVGNIKFDDSNYLAVGITIPF